MKLVTFLLLFVVVLYVVDSVSSRRIRPPPRTRSPRTRPPCYVNANCPVQDVPVCGTVNRRGRIINCNFSNQCLLNNHKCIKRESKLIYIRQLKLINEMNTFLFTAWTSRRGRCGQKSSNRDCS